MKQTIIAIIIALIAIAMFTLIVPTKAVSAPEIKKPEQTAAADQKTEQSESADDDEDDSDPEATS